MKNVSLILLALVISSIFLGCVQKPEGTPAPTATPTVTPTAPTAVPTTSTPAPTPTPVRIPAVFKFDVDDVYGFYRVRLVDSTLPPNYSNFTLTINAGDKVVWVSDSTDYTITIVSEQGLWDNTSAKLRWNYQQFSYTFTQPGEYGVYMKEYPRKRQKIIVNP